MIKDTLLRFNSIEEEIEHEAQMISFRILSEVEKQCTQMGINKTHLAEKIGVSKSYITQLFRGTKQVNMVLLAKIELALGITFIFSTGDTWRLWALNTENQ